MKAFIDKFLNAPVTRKEILFAEAGAFLALIYIHQKDKEFVLNHIIYLYNSSISQGECITKLAKSNNS